MDNQITEKDLAAINKYTRRTLKADEVYTFGVILCDNEIDRDLERFDSEALPVLAKMFVGKTGIFDHCASAKNQRARIFDAECITDEGRKTQAGEAYRCISAKAYIPQTKANAALIEEIDSGIKKEVSVGCAMARVTCSVCGEELRTGSCTHKRGRSYKDEICHAVLQEPADAYEWSFVAVPAQPMAGVQSGVRKEGAGGRFVVNKKSGNYYDGNDSCMGTPRHAPTDGSTSKERLPSPPTPNTEQEELLQIRASVREETISLALAVMPALDKDTAHSMCSQLSFKQCRDFAGALREKQALAKPRTPQLAVPKNNSVEQNTAFRI